MMLYHASSKNYANGNIVGPFEQNSFFINTIMPNGHQNVEHILEQARPKEMPSRMEAVYAFADPAQCICYMKAQGAAQFFLYQVGMASKATCPMPLVDIIRNHIDSARVAEALAQEYWEPKGQWKFTEYLAKSMQIVAEVDRNQYDMQVYAAHLQYQEDVKSGGELVTQTQKSIDMP